MANQAKLKSFHSTPIYKFGVIVPCNHGKAMGLKKANGNKLWREAELRELAQIYEYEAFIDCKNKRPSHP